MTGVWVGQYTGVLAEALLPRRWPAAIAVDEWKVRTVRYCEDGTRVQRGSDHYVVMPVVGYRNRPLVEARRPSGQQRSRLEHRFRRAGPALRPAAKHPRPRRRLGRVERRRRALADIRRYGCVWHREERPACSATSHASTSYSRSSGFTCPDSTTPTPTPAFCERTTSPTPELPRRAAGMMTQGSQPCGGLGQNQLTWE